MPDTPIDLSEGIQSVRLKVPTAEVPIPPEGFGQLHTPAPGELALRLPDGSVVAIGGGGGGGGAATSVLGPGGAIDAANSDPRIGININAVPGTGIAFTGRFLDQFARPLGVQWEPVTITSAELLALGAAPKVLIAAWPALTVCPVVLVQRYHPGGTPYTGAPNFVYGWIDDDDTFLGSVNGPSALVGGGDPDNVIQIESGAGLLGITPAFDGKRFAVLNFGDPLVDGNGTLSVVLGYLPV